MKVTEFGYVRRATLVMLAVSTLPSAVNAGTINWNATYVNDAGLSGPDFATFQSEIGATLNYYTTTWSAPTAITVSVKFHAGNTGLGTTQGQYSVVPYQDYRNALASTGNSAIDAAHLANLPNSANNPVNGSTTFDNPNPLLRALGLPTTPTAEPDGDIILNTTIMTLSRTGPMAPGTYDLRQVVYHELNEVLGFVSNLNGVPQAAGPGPTGAISAADLLRYDGVGSRSWNSDYANAAQPFLSYDNGVTNLANYNIAASGGDRQDFSGSPFFSVQDASSTPDIRLDNAVAEEAFLDAIGYNRLAVPEPASALLVAVAIGSLLTSRRTLGRLHRS